MSINHSAYRAHLDAHPVDDHDAIGLIRRDLSYDGPIHSDHARAFYQRVVDQYDTLAAQLARCQAAARP